ncbi:unnamed protein product [Moneuplotes crassus]|uniref:Uncharacterized protein n=1 Tax=Euplotes crassus TaxID=5936 RepID=A0AAD1YAB5_EUPCR|nr:unnamed protein product [Moneuplotes crassus]
MKNLLLSTEDRLNTVNGSRCPSREAPLKEIRYACGFRFVFFSEFLGIKKLLNEEGKISTTKTVNPLFEILYRYFEDNLLACSSFGAIFSPLFGGNLNISQNMNSYRKILKPSFNQLKELSQLECSNGNFTHLPMRFSKDAESSQREFYLELAKNYQEIPMEKDLYLNFVHAKSEESEKCFKHFLRNYDIEKIKFERALQSFTTGRKIRRHENTDKKINTEIENSIQGLCFRKPKKSIFHPSGNVSIRAQTRLLRLNSKKSPASRKIPTCFTPPPLERRDVVFSSTDLRKRTNEYYKNFAKLTLENDQARELRKKRRHLSVDKSERNTRNFKKAISFIPSEVQKPISLGDSLIKITPHKQKTKKTIKMKRITFKKPQRKKIEYKRPGYHKEKRYPVLKELFDILDSLQEKAVPKRLATVKERRSKYSSTCRPKKYRCKKGSGRMVPRSRNTKLSFIKSDSLIRERNIFTASKVCSSRMRVKSPETTSTNFESNL